MAQGWRKSSTSVCISQARLYHQPTVAAVLESVRRKYHFSQRPAVSEFVTSKQVSITLQGRGQVLAEGARRATGARTCAWWNQNRNGNMNSNPPVEPNKSPDKKRRYLTAEKKFQIYLEAQASDKPVGELLRREGLYSTDLARIRQQVRKGRSSGWAPNLGASRTRSAPRPTKPSSMNSRRRSGPWRICRSKLAILRKKTNGGSWDR